MSTPTHVRALRHAPERTHWNGPRTQLAAALERAAWRATEHTSHSLDSASAKKRDVLAVLADAIVCAVHDGAIADLALYAWTPEAPSLLGALRHELLCGRTRREWSDSDLLQVVTAIEQLITALDGDVAVQFAQQFSGRDAQQRLIELAHDMRSPLNAILLLVERMQHGHNGAVSGPQQQHLALVYSAAFGLSSMANDLMDVARGGARLLAEPPRAFSISALLRSVRDVVQPLAAERRLSLRFSSPPDDLRVGQESALNRVLLNLTTNALKFTTVGSVTVLIEQTVNADELLFVVEDTGRGIAPSRLEEIFPSAQTTIPDASQSFTADGLGLAICHKLVTAMRGTLQIESRVDHGTRFSFTVCLPRPDN
ncbi:MAG: HAMP domain-containing sensor histidine kinase [Gemmatimonadaceae bacterium]